MSGFLPALNPKKFTAGRGRRLDRRFTAGQRRWRQQSLASEREEIRLGIITAESAKDAKAENSRNNLHRRDLRFFTMRRQRRIFPQQSVRHCPKLSVLNYKFSICIFMFAPLPTTAPTHNRNRWRQKTKMPAQSLPAAQPRGRAGQYRSAHGETWSALRSYACQPPARCS